MKLYFLRHGIAEDPGPGQRDYDRRLTQEGIAETVRASLGLRRMKLGLDAIVTSPLLRARETAALVARGLQMDERLREAPQLACGCQLHQLEEALRDLEPGSRVLLVGHEPDFSEMISQLIGGGSVRMKKASMAYVDVMTVGPGQGELRWLLTARQLGALAGTVSVGSGVVGMDDPGVSG